MGRPLKNLPQKQIIRRISAIRGRNNRAWMSLLALALSAKPRKAKRIIRAIVENDRQVTKWTARL